MTTADITTPDLSKALIDKARSLGQMPLMARPDGTVATLAEAYIPLLVNFTFEDKAAKGLRKLQDQAEPEPPVYFSALEMVGEHTALLLAGETGSGKTSFARHLAFRLAEGAVGGDLLARNDLGSRRDENWSLDRVLPLLVPIVSTQSFSALIETAQPGINDWLVAKDWQATGQTLLIILDGVEVAGENGVALMRDALTFIERHPPVRLLVLGESSVVKCWALPPLLARYDLLPLLQAQRRAAALNLADMDLAEMGLALGKAAANPAQFVMALSAGDAGDDAERIVDAWLTRIAGDTGSIDFLCGLAYDALMGTLDDADVLPVTRVRQLLAARHLASGSASAAVAAFRSNPSLWTPVLVSLARRLSNSSDAEKLVSALINGEGDDVLRGALLAADLQENRGKLQRHVKGLLLAIVEGSHLSALEREKAGRRLAAFGDPRDLQTLASVPEGTLTFGSNTHPNCAPPHAIRVAAFRIGLYPVVNADYGVFVRTTGRLWRSPDGFEAERASAPATDLTWHDARAYCAWLTARWQDEGVISRHEIVRLPTEPEWERACRGDQADAGDDVIVYPWGSVWENDAANSEEAGFNTTCTVGLFPKGRSPYGCFDMTGQIWEWCTTLWGDDMATPSFRYPYADDGREALDAAPRIRRVLRGGCFSSGKMKACTTYRGSLEPDGFWRGNGFRIVVSAIPATVVSG